MRVSTVESGSRIIPARAGFTSVRSGSCGAPQDHPRSRGVYLDALQSYHNPGGSSPLARGLRIFRVRNSTRGRIIPARAGFTRRRTRWPRETQDHPRSRGVYRIGVRQDITVKGSSPLARGLRDRIPDGRDRVRIIPARAGFTRGRSGLRSGSWDHPRSRGVYAALNSSAVISPGSSPLARGLRGTVELPFGEDRIIPARAGFTARRPPTRARRRDHPRSRGVYILSFRVARCSSGSSPLARGLPTDISQVFEETGIIPARAGFTRCPTASHSPFQDHPRSRGVYTCGSLESQRTRTLPDPCCLHCRPRVRSAELR